MNTYCRLYILGHAWTLEQWEHNNSHSFLGSLLFNLNGIHCYCVLAGVLDSILNYLYNLLSIPLEMSKDMCQKDLKQATIGLGNLTCKQTPHIDGFVWRIRAEQALFGSVPLPVVKRHRNPLNNKCHKSKAWFWFVWYCVCVWIFLEETVTFCCLKMWNPATCWKHMCTWNSRWNTSAVWTISCITGGVLSMRGEKTAGKCICWFLAMVLSSCSQFYVRITCATRIWIGAFGRKDQH